ncbi:MAG TPA: peptidase [Porphyromonadaceae bacterium]|jgi:hypothetical protein|nr:peptidase [Porphyromonadaceae bacterium]
MRSLKSKSAAYWFRQLHRDIGFIAVGFCFVYAISGILLNHLNEKDPAYRTENKSLQLQAGLSADEIAEVWSGRGNLPPLNKVMKIDEDHLRLLLDKGVGVYDRRTGDLDYELYHKRAFVYWINKMHYNKVGGWTVMADLFAVSLLFLAISGLLIVKGQKGIAGRGKWYLLLGILIPVIYVILS